MKKVNYERFKDCAPLNISVSYVFDESLGDAGEYRPLAPSDFSGGGGGSGGDASAANQETEIEHLTAIESALGEINDKTLSLTKGQNTMVNSLPVVLASNQSAVPVSSTTLATVANQTTQLTRLGNTTDASVASPDTNGSLIALTKGIVILLNNLQPPKSGSAVTPSDTVNIVGSVTALWVGVGGDVSVQTQSGAVLFKNVPNGTKLDIQAIRVNETGTTATDIVALLK